MIYGIVSDRKVKLVSIVADYVQARCGDMKYVMQSIKCAVRFQVSDVFII